MLLSLSAEEQIIIEGNMVTAIKNDNVDEIKRLMKLGGDINMRLRLGVKTKYEENLLHTAAKYRSIKAAGFLINNMENVKECLAQEGLNNFTPLHWGVQSACIPIVKLYAQNGAPLNALDYFSYNPLMVSLWLTEKHCSIRNRKKRDKISKMLIELGCDVNQTDVYGNTSLHFWCGSCSDISVLQCLVDHKADVNHKNNMGEVPLYRYMTRFYGLDKDNFAAIRVFIDNNADLNAVTNDGVSLLHAAASNETPNLTKLIYENGGNLETKDMRGWGQLGIAILHGNIYKDYSSADYLASKGFSISENEAEWILTSPALKERFECSIQKCSENDIER